MRKILLASTALVAVAGISAASAEISLSGGTDVSYTTVSDDQADNASTGVNDNSMASDTDLAASWSTTTDSGLAISVSYDIDGDSGNASITGDWGTFSYDDGNEAMGVGGGDADSVSNMGITGRNTVSYNGGEAIGGGMIAYSNSIGGIEFGVGLSNGGTASAADETSYGVSYSSSVNGADVSVSYAAASTGADNSSANATDLNASSMTVGVSVGNISVAMAQNAQKATRNDDNSSATGYSDLKSTNMGITYAVTDSLTLEAASVAAEGTYTSNTDYKYDESAYGIAYSVASGVTLTASYSDFTQSGGGQGDFSGTGTTVKLAISF
ncbi:porin [Alphaproteobacteria bacterium]|nr:porin [Alphaproteobacteria bacterium]